MNKIIKIDCVNNYFLDEISGEIVNKYDPDNKFLSLVTKLEDDSILTVKNEQIIQKYGGQIIFEYGEDKYIIDDGYQNILIRAGYIVKNKFDISTNFISERSIGIEHRNEMFEYIKSVANYVLQEYHYASKISCKENQSIEIKFFNAATGHEFNVIIDTINSIVNKNQQRKLNDLPFYPFLKSMDKYGTMYLSIFCKKIISYDQTEEEQKKKYKVAEDFIINFINELNKKATDTNDQYRFERTIIKKRINYTEGI